MRPQDSHDGRPGELQIGPFGFGFGLWLMDEYRHFTTPCSSYDTNILQPLSYHHSFIIFTAILIIHHHHHLIYLLVVHDKPFYLHLSKTQTLSASAFTPQLSSSSIWGKSPDRLFRLHVTFRRFEFFGMWGAPTFCLMRCRYWKQLRTCRGCCIWCYLL